MAAGMKRSLPCRKDDGVESQQKTRDAHEEGHLPQVPAPPVREMNHVAEKGGGNPGDEILRREGKHHGELIGHAHPTKGVPARLDAGQDLGRRQHGAAAVKNGKAHDGFQPLSGPREPQGQVDNGRDPRVVDILDVTGEDLHRNGKNPQETPPGGGFLQAPSMARKSSGAQIMVQRFGRCPA